VRLPIIPEVISYDLKIHPEEFDSITLVDTFADPTADSAELVKREEQRQTIRAALKVMRPKERITILLRASGMTLEQIGHQMGVCRERVRQWERDARLVARGMPRHGVADGMRRCKNCGAEFTPTRSRHWFCSDSCGDKDKARRAYRKKRLEQEKWSRRQRVLAVARESLERKRRKA
jgi:transcriptional regulator with XRE-family HTH domain